MFDWSNPLKMGIDVLIFTPVELEYLAVVPLLTGAQFLQDPTTGRGYLIGHVDTAGGRLKVGLMRSGKGVHDTHDAVRAGTDALSPRIAILFGMAGGLRKTNIGDVLIGTHGRNYERGKVTDNGFLGNPESLPCSKRLVEKALSLSRNTNDWHPYLPESKHALPKVYDGPIVSGDKVIDTEENELRSILKSQHYEAVGVEMEAYSFLVSAAHRSGTEAIIIRGVSDWLKNKDEANAAGSKEFSLSRAVAFLRYFLESLEEQPARTPGAWMKRVSSVVIFCALAGSGILLVQPSIAPASAPLLTDGFPIEIPPPELPLKPENKEIVVAPAVSMTKPPRSLQYQPVEAGNEATVFTDTDTSAKSPVLSAQPSTAPPEKPARPPEEVELYPFRFQFFQAEGEPVPLRGYLIDDETIYPDGDRYLLSLGEHLLKITINAIPYEIRFYVKEDPLDNRLYREFY